jgi:hypothetical protein
LLAGIILSGWLDGIILAGWMAGTGFGNNLP